jgi:hypothetical protein
LIINHLHPKNHETTGKKPAKQEINNKQNMKTKLQHPINPHPENLKILKILIQTKTPHTCKNDYH